MPLPAAGAAYILPSLARRRTTLLAALGGFLGDSATKAGAITARRAATARYLDALRDNHPARQQRRLLLVCSTLRFVVAALRTRRWRGERRHAQSVTGGARRATAGCCACGWRERGRRENIGRHGEWTRGRRAAFRPHRLRWTANNNVTFLVPRTETFLRGISAAFAASISSHGDAQHASDSGLNASP